MAEKLSDPERANPDVVETAGLAHDLGHPPFGHVGEHELDRLVKIHCGPNQPGFEGNAQSFRVVTRLATASDNYPGLNLTAAALNAVLKYPWGYGYVGSPKSTKKYGYYPEDAWHFDWARSRSVTRDMRHIRTVEAEIMDHADGLTYSVHDLEDHYRDKLIPLDLILVSDEEWYLFLKDWRRAAESLEETAKAKLIHTIDWCEDDAKSPEGLRQRLLSQYTSPQSEFLSRSHRTRIRFASSWLIGRQVAAVNLNDEPDDRGNWLAVDDQYYHELKFLQRLVWYYVIERQSLGSQQHGYRKILTALFDELMKDLSATGAARLFSSMFSDAAREAVTDAQRARLCADYLCSLSDSQALRFAHRVLGWAPGSVYDALP